MAKESVKKMKRYWAVSCMICEATVDLDIGDYRIISTDQCAEFIQVPKFQCGVCQSACVVELTEK